LGEVSATKTSQRGLIGSEYLVPTALLLHLRISPRIDADRDLSWRRLGRLSYSCKEDRISQRPEPAIFLILKFFISALIGIISFPTFVPAILSSPLLPLEPSAASSCSKLSRRALLVNLTGCWGGFVWREAPGTNLLEGVARRSGCNQ